MKPKFHNSSYLYITATALALIVICPPGRADAAPTCEATDYAGVQHCLGQTARPLTILLRNDLVLSVGQRITLDELQNVSLKGASGTNHDQPVTISETVERMRAADPQSKRGCQQSLSGDWRKRAQYHRLQSQIHRCSRQHGLFARALPDRGKSKSKAQHFVGRSILLCADLAWVCAVNWRGDNAKHPA
jgi:hypothetical protein